MSNSAFRALADPIRRQILLMLKTGDLSVSEISSNFAISLPSLSHHLSVLKQAGLVLSEKRGQERIYSLNLSIFEEVAAALITFFKK